MTSLRQHYSRSSRDQSFESDQKSPVLSIGVFEPPADILERIAFLYIRSKGPTQSNWGYSFGRANSSRVDSMDGILAFWASRDDDMRRSVNLHDNALKDSFSPPEWLKLAEAGGAELTLHQMGLIVDAISQALYNAEFDIVDGGLASAEPARMSIDAVVAVSRTTFPARNRLSNWPAFIARADREVKSRGEPEDIMAGLV